MIRGATASTNQARMLAWIIISFALALQMSVAHAQIVSPTRQRAYRALLPTVSDAELQELLDDPGLVYWDEATHPRAYQAFGAHFHRASYNLSGARDKTGNAAADFPWRSTVGTDECRDLWTFKAMRLPQRSPDAIWPVVWHSSWTDTFRHQPARERRWRWMWPKGSEFLEVIVWRYRGADYPICVLYRVKEDAGYGTVHGVEVAVPYAAQDEYIQDLVHWLEEGGCTVESTRTENILNVNGFRCRVFVNPHKGTVEKKLDEPINIIIYKDDCYIIPVRSLPHNAKKIDLTFNALPSYLKYKNSLGMLDPWG